MEVGTTWYPSLPGPAQRFWRYLGRRVGEPAAKVLRWTVRMLVFATLAWALVPYVLRINRSGQIMLAVMLIGSLAAPTQPRTSAPCLSALYNDMLV